MLRPSGQADARLGEPGDRPGHVRNAERCPEPVLMMAVLRRTMGCERDESRQRAIMWEMVHDYQRF
jgi:hypothetical protein